MLEVKELKAPKDIRDTEDKAAERAQLFLKSNLKRLSETKSSQIEKKLDKWYTAWKKQTTKQRNDLVKYFELMEGVVQDSNVPFEGASNTTLHYAAGIARTFDATFSKTSYQDMDIFYPILSPALEKKLQDQKSSIQQLEESFNYSFWGACNGLKTLKEGTVPCVRDGTLVVSGRWHRQVRRCFDQRIYRSIEDFRKDYPDQESAGITEEEYAEILDFFLAHGEPTAINEEASPSQNGQPGQGDIMSKQEENTDKPELVVTFEYNHLFKNEPEYKIGPWAKFVRYPLSARDISELLMYGYQVVEDRETVKQKSGKEYYERGSKKSLDSTGTMETDSWDRALGFVEGISQPIGKEDKPIKLIEGVCLLDLDDSGIPAKYQFKYDFESKSLLSLTPHRLRRGIDACVIFRMVKRENRLDGVSLIGDCEDLFNQIDFNVRHRNNVRILTTSPIFIANQSLKDTIDLGRAENVIRPGVTYWVPDPSENKSIRQLQVQDLSTSQDNMDELILYKQHVELVFGPSQGLSGSQTPQDKRQPGNKTIALLNQANARIDRYIDQFMESGPDLAKLHSALLFQYAEGPDIKYSTGSKQLALPLDLLGDPGLSWGIKRRSVQLTPEFAMARLASLMQLWMQLLPRIGTQDPIAIELWNRQVLSSGEPQAEKFILEGQNMQKVMQSFQAMVQMNPNNPDMKAKQKGKEAFNKRMGTHAADRLMGKNEVALSR